MTDSSCLLRHAQVVCRSVEIVMRAAALLVARRPLSTCPGRAYRHRSGCRVRWPLSGIGGVEVLSAVVAYRSGDIDQAHQIAAALSEEELIEVSETLSELIDESSGWFAAWCRDGLTILESERPDMSGMPASSEARCCSECGTARPSGARLCISCASAFLAAPHSPKELLRSPPLIPGPGNRSDGA